MSDVIRAAYKRTVWALVLRGLLAVFIGVFVIWRPLDSISAFALLIAWWALFSGVTQLVHAVELRNVFSKWWVLLLTGIVGVAFGIAALVYYPSLSLAFAVAWVCWWLIVTGALAIYVAMFERSHGLPWRWTAAFGVLSIVVAAYGLMSPPATLAAIMGLIAGFALVSGLVQLMGALKLVSIKSELSDALPAAGAR